ncbi:hypothetical protein PAEPH01_1671 [Pancytospora epiphaga]|nr:hypothetical protein PAEPH01_1671 [Pancytospora epiphaga]
MLSTIFTMLRWIAQVGAVSDKITLNFTDGSNGEYEVSNKVINASEFLSGFRRFHGGTDRVTENSTVTMDCSSQMFNMIDKLINEENIENYEEIANEPTLYVVCEFFEVLEYLLYDYEVSEIIHKRLIVHILSRIVFSVTNEEQRSAYIESSNEYIKDVIKNQIKFILPLYLQRYNLGVRKEENIAVIYKDAENKNQKEILELIRTGELRILPGALDNDMNENVDTDDNQRLGVLLWMFDVCLGVSTLDLSEYTLTDGLMGQLSAMRHLKTLNLRECLVKLDYDCDLIGSGFKALEDLDISGVKIDDNVVCILSKIENLRKLSLIGCSVKLDNDCDCIETGFKALEVLDFSGVKIDENVVCILSKIENLKRLNLRECSMKLDNEYDWMGTGFKALEVLYISGMKLEKVSVGILCRTINLKKLNMEKCFIKPDSSLEFIRELKDLKELRIGGNYLSEEHLNIIFSHENIEVLDMDSCIVDDMYIYGGKIESLEMLKEFNGRKICMEDGEMRITLLETDEECCLENWKTYNGRLMFFTDDGEIKINLLTDETGSDVLESKSKTWRLSELNGSQVFIVDDKEIRIVLPQISSIMEELNESMLGEIYFTGKKNGKMNFLDVMKDNGFMKNVEEYNCEQVYFADKQIDMILSHEGLKKLNMRQCGLESKAIMKIKDMSRLIELDLSDNNKIEEDDMIHIIKECPNLRRLNMNKCRMIIAGGFKGILALERLEELNIGGNLLDDDCYKFIFKHKKLLRLNLEECKLVEDNLKGIDDLKGLKELFIGHNLISKRDLNRIFKLKELEVLDMFNSRLFDKEHERKININGIKSLKKLKVLDMRDTRLHEKNIDGIFELKELRDLRIEDYWGHCEFFKNISNLINLEKVSIWRFKIDENDMESITSLKNLKELSMFGCGIYGDRAFDNIGKLNNSLRLLSIKVCNVHKNECIKKLIELTNLRELRLIINVSFETLCDILKKLTCLRVLYLCNMNTEEFISCENFPLPSLSKLEILDLKCIDLSDEFIKGLRNLVNLKELSLTCRTENKNDKLDT